MGSRSEEKGTSGFWVLEIQETLKLCSQIFLPPHLNKPWLGWLPSQAASSSGLAAFQLSGPRRELLLVSRYSRKPRTLFIPNSELRAGEGMHKKGSPGRWEQLWGQERGWVSIPHAPARQAGRETGWVVMGI